LSLVATITVSGNPQVLRQYRDEVNRLLQEEDSGPFRELHTSDRLEYEFRVRGGIPFPPFVSASHSFPEVTVDVRWSESATGLGGHAVIRNGALAEQNAAGRAADGTVWSQVYAARDGTLQLALTCTRWRDGWHGYAVASGEHAFFRVTGSAGACELLASDGVEGEWAERWSIAPGGEHYAELALREAIAEDELRELDRLAQEFSREWIWFEESPPEETAVERQRFAAYGYPVRGANLRSEKLRRVLQPDGGGLAFRSFGPESLWVPELLRRCWRGNR
jgi:hypothetical protein